MCEACRRLQCDDRKLGDAYIEVEEGWITEAFDPATGWRWLAGIGTVELDLTVIDRWLELNRERLELQRGYLEAVNEEAI